MPHPESGEFIFGLLGNGDLSMRKAAAKALAAVVCAEGAADAFPDVVSRLTDTHRCHSVSFLISSGEGGDADEDGAHASWRSGCLLALASCHTCPDIDSAAEALFHFLVREALGDYNESIRDQAVQTGLKLIDAVNSAHQMSTLQLLEGFLQEADEGDDSDLRAQDMAREGAVVLLGAAAKHLPKDSPKLWSVVDKMLSSTTIPSEAVQRNVGKCLIPLMKVRRRSLFAL